MFDTDIDVTDWVSGFVRSIIGTRYICCGYGCGADRVSSCVSVNVPETDVDSFVDCVVRVKGAKTVRYGFASASSWRANGFFGTLDGRFAFGFFFEKGSSENRAVDRHGVSESGVESGIPVEIWDVNKDLA